MRATQSAAAAKTLANSTVAQEHTKAASSDCHTADINQDRISANTSASYSSSSNESSEQQTHQPQSVGSQETLLGIAIMPVDHARMQVMQQQAASHADISSVTSSSTQQPLFFVPVDALVCKADTSNPAQQNQQQQQPSLLPTSFLFAESTPRSLGSSSLPESQRVYTNYGQNCSHLVMNLLTTQRTMCFNSQGKPCGPWHWCCSCWCNIKTH